MSTYWKKGSWNVTCDVCGFEFKSHELKKRWDGMMVCKADWEPRHEMDFYRARPEKPAIPWSRPGEGNDTVTTITSNTVLTASQAANFVYYGDTSSGAITIELPVTGAPGWSTYPLITIHVVHYDGDSNITIAMNALDTLMGSAIIRPGTSGIFTTNKDSTWIRIF